LNLQVKFDFEASFYNDVAFYYPLCVAENDYLLLSLSLKNMFLNDPEESGWFYANQTQLVYCCFGIIQHISLLLLQLF
jgi:hypothetical protein